MASIGTFETWSEMRIMFGSTNTKEAFWGIFKGRAIQAAGIQGKPVCVRMS